MLLLGWRDVPVEEEKLGAEESDAGAALCERLRRFFGTSDVSGHVNGPAVIREERARIRRVSARGDERELSRRVCAPGLFPGIEDKVARASVQNRLLPLVRQFRQADDAGNQGDSLHPRQDRRVSRDPAALRRDPRDIRRIESRNLRGKQLLRDDNDRNLRGRAFFRVLSRQRVKELTPHVLDVGAPLAQVRIRDGAELFREGTRSADDGVFGALTGADRPFHLFEKERIPEHHQAGCGEFSVGGTGREGKPLHRFSGSGESFMQLPQVFFDVADSVVLPFRERNRPKDPDPRHSDAGDDGRPRKTSFHTLHLPEAIDRRKIIVDSVHYSK